MFIAKTNSLRLILAVLLVFFQAFPASAIQNIPPVSAYQYGTLGHEAYAGNDFLKAGELYEKAYSLQKDKIYKDNAIASYFNYAFDEASKKNYDEAAKYCHKILGIDPNHQNTKELLADIYYTKGSENFYRGNVSIARQDLENSLKYSVFPEQAQKAREGLSMINDPAANNLKGDFEPSDIKPVNASIPETIPEILNLMEMKTYGETKQKLPLINRIQSLETDIYNINFEGENIASRLERLRKRLLPELADRPVNNNSAQKDNYIMEIIEQSRGTARIFGEMPILIYMEDGNTKNYKRDYKDAVKEAMKSWEDTTNGKIKFKITNNPDHLNLKIEWIDYFEDFAWAPELQKEDISAQKEKIKYGKASTLVQVGSIAAMVLGGLTGVPVIGMLGSVGGSVASPLLRYKSLDLDDRAILVKINTAITEGMTKEQAHQKIKQIAMHQLGHAIGIYGHSPNPDDIMYGNFSAAGISERDKKTINEIYRDVATEKK